MDSLCKNTIKCYKILGQFILSGNKVNIITESFIVFLGLGFTVTDTNIYTN